MMNVASKGLARVCRDLAKYQKDLKEDVKIRKKIIKAGDKLFGKSQKRAIKRLLDKKDKIEDKTIVDFEKKARIFDALNKLFKEEGLK